MKNRYINTKFWSDAYTADLDPIEKLLFIYFITNERVNMAGMYELPLKVAAVETGIDRDMVGKVVERFAKDGKVFFVDGWVVVKNFGKYQSDRNPKIRKAVADAMAKIPDRIKEVLQSRHNLSIGDGYPNDTQSHLDSDQDSDGDSIQKKTKKKVASSVDIDPDFLKKCEVSLFPILQSVDGYPFDAEKDSVMLWGLKQKYPDRSLQMILERWAFSVNNGHLLGKDPRMQIIRWVSRSKGDDEAV